MLKPIIQQMVRTMVINDEANGHRCAANAFTSVSVGLNGEFAATPLE
ncbi:hypothetical protein [Prochlorococcus marinus]|nr:hypothetical protein [Prochlorococcus marinus]